MKHTVIYGFVVLALSAFFTGTALADTFEGRAKCSSCHKSQAKSWKDTAHAKAMESLKPGTRKEVDGLGKKGGYTIEAAKKPLAAVGCESCHGPGKAYRGDHRKAGQAFESKGTTMQRKVLADKGQDFQFEEACSACHLNYEGSPWKGAKAPYTPFTPAVDKKYTFDFEKMVKDVKAMHEHYKLDGTFVGEPKFKFHDEFQANAKEKVADKKDKKGKE